VDLCQQDWLIALPQTQLFDPNTTNFHRELTARSRSKTLAATVDNVRRTCVGLAGTPGCPVRIDEGRARSFVGELDLELLKRSSHCMEIPLEFPDVPSEVCFHITLHLFNFGHGFRHALHQVCGVGAWGTMKRGIEALHATTAKGLIDAHTLLNLSEGAVDELFFRLAPQQSPAAAGRIAPLRKMIVGVAHAAGKRLLDLGYRTFAQFVSDHSRATGQGRPSALALVKALADHFPPFDDRRALPGGDEVLFLKKAQLAVAELYQRLGDSHTPFAFEDVKGLTVACDNVLPCVLRSLGILRIRPELARKIDARDPLPAGPEEAHLRAAGIAATEIMLQYSKGAFWAKELGDHLWTLGKHPKFRQVERHATPDTCFY
jgi:hypothetical protein